MEEVTHIGNHQHGYQVPQDLGAVLRHHRADEAGHAYGGELDDEVHNLHKDLVEAVDDLSGHQAPVPGQHHAEAQQQGDDNHLQHDGVRQRSNGVGGEDIHNGGHDALALGRGVLQAAGLQRREQADALGHRGQNQSQHHGKGGGTHVVDHGLSAHRTDLTDILHGDNARRDGEQNDGHHHELQKIQEDVAPRLDVTQRKVLACHAANIGVHQQQACHDAHDQTHKDPQSQRQLFLIHKISPSSAPDPLGSVSLGRRPAILPSGHPRGFSPFHLCRYYTMPPPPFTSQFATFFFSSFKIRLRFPFFSPLPLPGKYFSVLPHFDRLFSIIW